MLWKQCRGEGWEHRPGPKEGWQVPSFPGREKRKHGEDRPGILSHPEDGDARARASPYVTTAGFTVTQRVSLALTVMPQAPPFAVSG